VQNQLRMANFWAIENRVLTTVYYTMARLGFGYHLDHLIESDLHFYDV